MAALDGEVTKARQASDTPRERQAADLQAWLCRQTHSRLPRTGTERVTKAAGSPIPCEPHSLLTALKSVLIYHVWVQF